MTATAVFRSVLRSTLRSALIRYSRSKGLWFLLLAGLIGARFFVPRNDGTTVLIAINQQLPEMTSAMLGTSIGIVITTLLLPLGFLYLRSNTTRRQPWQIAEVTAAPRVAVALGSFLADSAIFGLVLLVLTAAAWGLAWLTLPVAEIHLWQIAVSLGLIGAPALLGMAAVRVLLDALPLTRRAFGDVVFFALWLTSITVPLVHATTGPPQSHLPGFHADMLDFCGFVDPLMRFAHNGDVEIGFGRAAHPGRIAIDVLQVLLSRDYVASRFAWAGIAFLVAIVAGLLYRPHTARLKTSLGSRMGRWFAPGPPPAAKHPLVAALPSRLPLLSLIGAQLRLILPGRLSLLLGGLIALGGLFADYRHVVSPALFLLLIFGLTAEAARSEARGMLALTSTMAMPPAMRRAAFCAAGAAGALLLSATSLAVHPSLHSLALAMEIGLGAAIFTMAVTAISRSAFAARLLLLLAWYGYISAK